MSRKKTFAEAKSELFAYLREHGWTVKTSGVMGNLKTPYATSPSGGLRLWFRPQAIYYTRGNQHNANSGLSLWIDIREVSPAEVVRIAEAEEKR